MPALTASLEIITAPLLGDVRHGFFTRRGGASSGIFEGLNCGNGSSDQSAIVAMNRDRVARALDVPAGQLVTVHQAHTARAVTLSSPPTEPVTADAIVTATPGLAIATSPQIASRSCFSDPTAGVIAAPMQAGAGRLTASSKRRSIRWRPQAQRAASTPSIGPAISQRVYEVGREFLERFMDDDADNARFFINGAEGKYLFDLPGYGLKRLRDAGVGAAEWTRHCTYSDAARFYSYRRSLHRGEADYGRLISAIRL
jgi:copper oxidase (laccase) domain-containing protein